MTTIAWIVLFVSVLYLIDRVMIWAGGRALEWYRRRRAATSNSPPIEKPP